MCEESPYERKPEPPVVCSATKTSMETSRTFKSELVSSDNCNEGNLSYKAIKVLDLAPTLTG